MKQMEKLEMGRGRSRTSTGWVAGSHGQVNGALSGMKGRRRPRSGGDSVGRREAASVDCLQATGIRRIVVTVHTDAATRNPAAAAEPLA